MWFVKKCILSQFQHFSLASVNTQYVNNKAVSTYISTLCAIPFRIHHSHGRWMTVGFRWVTQTCLIRVWARRKRRKKNLWRPSALLSSKRWKSERLKKILKLFLYVYCPWLVQQCSSSGFCEMFLFTSLQDPLLNEEEEEEDEEETEKPQRVVRKAWIMNLSQLLSDLLRLASFSTCVMFSGAESCACQQRGHEAAPQRVPEADQRSVRTLLSSWLLIFRVLQRHYLKSRIKMLK